MSDAKPFAEVKPETSVGDAEGYAVAVGDETLCPPWGNYSEIGAEVVARTLNAAVARERREAAAEALREAVELFPSGRSAKNGELWTSEQIHAALRAVLGAQVVCARSGAGGHGIRTYRVGRSVQRANRRPARGRGWVMLTEKAFDALSNKEKRAFVERVAAAKDAEIAKLRAEVEAEKNHARQSQAESLDYATNLDESRMERGRLAEQLSAARAALDGEREACDAWRAKCRDYRGGGFDNDGKKYLVLCPECKAHDARRAAEAAQARPETSVTRTDPVTGETVCRAAEAQPKENP